MNSFLRVAAISNKVTILEPMTTAKEILNKIEEVKKFNPDIIFLPTLATIGSNLGNFKNNKTLKQNTLDSISFIAEQTKKFDGFIVIGGLLADSSENSPMTFVCYKGQIEAVLKSDEVDCVFSVRGISFNIIAKNINECFNYTQQLKTVGADVTLLACNQTAVAGNTLNFKEDLKTLSKVLNSGLMVCNSGCGDTSFPNITKGFVGAFECGEILSFKSAYVDSCYTTVDFDNDIIKAIKLQNNVEVEHIDAEFEIDVPAKKDIMRIVNKIPYLPENELERDRYLQDLLSLQATSLMVRMKNISCENIVIGISGGLDSTLTLIASVKAMDMLNLPRKNITTITMQGFGTSGTTYASAMALMESFGCTIKEIPIKDSILQHFKDIDHDVNVHDVTYENAQARERAQILLDYANKVNGIVVGTGDLSEEALGFCTFSGDHIANFNVNTCITKTTIREIINYIIKINMFENSSQVLQKILDTPVSPELLPPDSNDNIMQKTEDILGPYLLHDFFLYHFVMYNFSASKIYYYAKKAFANDFDDEYLKAKLKIFFNRLITSQFKRSCAPDSAIIDKMNLANDTFYIPSDANAKIFIQEIDSLN